MANRLLGALAAILTALFSSSTRQSSHGGGGGGTKPRARIRTEPDHASTGRSSGSGQQGVGAAPGGDTETVEVDPARVDNLRLTYAPDRDGTPDAGEIVWTWVPYAERDGRGKDRPVLVIGRHSADSVYAVRLTSKSHEGDRDFLALGTGEWDAQGRPSWVDIEQLYIVHDKGMRREAAVLDRERFGSIATALSRRFGWKFA